jgi:hypothetical protein
MGGTVMTVQGLIERLTLMVQHGTKPTAIVQIFNSDIGGPGVVTGVLFDNDHVELCSDISEMEEDACDRDANGVLKEWAI